MHTATWGLAGDEKGGVGMNPEDRTNPVFQVLLAKAAVANVAQKLR